MNICFNCTTCQNSMLGAGEAAVGKRGPSHRLLGTYNLSITEPTDNCDLYFSEPKTL